jgi:hypothetical protein
MHLIIRQAHGADDTGRERSDGDIAIRDNHILAAGPRG